MAPELMAAFFHCAPHVHQLIPPHVVEGPSSPGRVSGDLNPVSPVIHATVAAHPASVSHLEQEDVVGLRARWRVRSRLIASSFYTRYVY